MRLAGSRAIDRGATSRKGAVTLLFAMLLLVFFGIAALTIDLGMASLTQNQMQTAVDTASLEGARMRDYDVYQFRSNQRRRGEVSELVRLVFDDDLTPTQGAAQPDGTFANPDDADALQLGAGPLIAVEGGTGPLAAGGVIEIAPERVVDDPILARNHALSTSTNQTHGDMLSGTFVADEGHAEASTYDRDDFVPGVYMPTGDSTDHQGLSFLVRMRRTTGENALDAQPGVSSRAPTVPYLWGLGTLMRSAGEGYDPRRDGITIRATAIASARPALRVGPAPLLADGAPVTDHLNRPILGISYVTFRSDFWKNESATTGAPWGTQVSLEVQPTSATSVNLLRNGVIVGRIRNPQTLTKLGSVPGNLSAAEISTLFPIAPSYRYFAITERIEDDDGAQVERVVGYGFGWTGSIPNFGLRFEKGFRSENPQVRCWVAHDNASAHLSDQVAPLSANEWDSVFAALRSLAYYDTDGDGLSDPSYDHNHVRAGILLAPALTR